MSKDLRLEVVDEKAVAAMGISSLSKLRNDRNFRRGLPFIKVGKSVRYRLSDIEAYLEKHSVQVRDTG